MHALARDVRRAVRSLARRPALSLVAVTSIALGIAFNAVIFSAINALLLRPVPGVEAGDRAVEIGRTTRGEGFDTFGYMDFLAMREGASPLAEVAAWRAGPLSWGTEEGGERLMGMMVSPGYFPALGVSAVRGRTLGPEEDARGGPAVVVVSHRFWQERLGGDPGVVGRTLELSRTPFTVIGVVAPGFDGHVPMMPVDVWTPISRAELADPSFDVALYDRPDAVWLHLVGRLREDATLERAGAAAAAVMARLAAEHPSSHGDRGARVVELGPVPGAGRGVVGGFLGVLMGLVGLILLITASNVAGMLLARAADRRKEIAIHLAIGAGRARLVRMLTAESLVLFLAGGAVGSALAFAGARLLSTVSLPGVPIRLDLGADVTVLLFALGLAAVTGIVFGLAPALQASRPDLVSALHAEGRGGRRTGRLRRWLAAGQVAVAMVLMVAAGLFLRSLQSAGRVDAGFDPAAVTVASVDLALEGYDSSTGPRIQAQILERVRAMPGVDRAALALDLPLDLGSHGNPSYPEPVDADPSGIGTEFNIVSDGYFEALGIPVHQGRAFTPSDRDGAPLVVMVNRVMAERAWPGEPAVGKRLRFREPGAPARTVVGVVADVKNQTLGEVVDPMVYLPAAQQWTPSVSVVAAGPGAGPAPLRSAILEADPRLAVGPPQDLAAIAGLGILPQRVAATLATALGALALFLSVLGVYGVVAHSVAGRRREVGIRMAVGASRRGVVGLFLRGGARMVLPGVAIGAVGALIVGRVVRSFLFGVSPADATTLGAVAVVTGGAVALATAIPALRAARLDPMEALRSE